jgi:hypothetical protein
LSRPKERPECQHGNGFLMLISIVGIGKVTRWQIWRIWRMRQYSYLMYWQKSVDGWCFMWPRIVV